MAIMKSCSRCGKIHAYGFKCYVGKVYKKNNIDNLRSSYAWTQKAEEIKRASNYLCAICLQEGIYNYKKLETHHIIKLQDEPDKLLDNYNLICLCKYHHRKADNGEIDQELLLRLAREREEQ